MLKNCLALALGSAALLTAPGVSAQQAETRTTGVTYDDLDLRDQEDVRELEQRIDRAAEQVCGMHQRETGSNRVSRDARECYRDAKRQLDRHFAEIIEEQQKLGG